MQQRFVWTMAALAVGCRTSLAQFKDVPKGHWAAEAVGKMAALGVMMPDKPKPAASGFDGSKAVTRYELALTLWRFVQYLERADKQKRGKSQVFAPRTGEEAVKALIAQGYLPKNSPLAKDGGKSVSADQLGDALTMVLAKVREKKVPVTPDSELAPIPRPSRAT